MVQNLINKIINFDNSNKPLNIVLKNNKSIQNELKLAFKQLKIFKRNSFFFSKIISNVKSR